MVMGDTGAVEIGTKDQGREGDTGLTGSASDRMPVMGWGESAPDWAPSCWRRM